MADANMNTIHITEKQKVQEITDKLEEGLKELFESEKYKTYLSTMSKFHNYSFNNTLLIAMQKPEATLVAGYKAWQKNFERHVNKGEKAIRILAPAPYKIKEELIDNVLNNGAEKAKREANKKDQEQPATRTSLKARLAEKKAQIEDPGKEHDAQENTKKNQREM